MDDQPVSAREGKCPFTGKIAARTNRDWWPNQLNLAVLHQHSALSNPMGAAFDYAKEFNSLDLNAVIKDLHALMTTRKIGCRAVSGITGPRSFGWPGTGPAPTVLASAVAAPGL